MSAPAVATLSERAQRIFPPVAARATELGITRASGSHVWDDRGNRYLDFGSGVAVANVGHNHPRVVAAATEQLQEAIHVGHNVSYYSTYVEFGERLVAEVGGERSVYFSNSGAEAIEGGVKLARAVTGRPAVVAFNRAFHGRTLGATALSASNARYRRGYEPLMSGVYHAEYPYAFRTGLSDEAEVARALADLDRLLAQHVDPDDVAAILIEPIQGEGGYVVPPEGFLEGVQARCREHGILLMTDEIQTGFGRTGTFLAAEHWGVDADIIAMAKGIANGFPLSALVARRDLMERWPAGSHGGTFGGNPVSCAAALAVLDVLHEEQLLERVTALGPTITTRLEEIVSGLSLHADVRGRGLMLAVELLDEEGRPDAVRCDAVRKHALAEGLILLPCGIDRNVVRLAPPLTVSDAELDEGLAIIESSYRAVTA